VDRQDGRTDSVAKWVASALPLLQLSHWQVSVSNDAAPDDAHADTTPHPQASTAVVRIGSTFWGQNAEEQRNTLTHELVHLLMCRIDQMSDSLEDTLGVAGWSVWQPLWENEHERAVEAVALLLSPHLPPFLLNETHTKAKK